MQFQVRDLLLATTLVAAYAAGLTYLIRLDSGLPTFPFFILVPACVALVVFIVAALIDGRRSLQRLGQQLVAWRSPYWWTPHALLVGGLVIYICLVSDTRPSTTAGEFLILPTFLSYLHLAFLFCGRFAIGENGVLVGMTYVSWEDCLIVLDEDAHAIVVEPAGKRWPERLQERLPAHKRVAVPDDYWDAVKTVLANKKPEALIADHRK